MLMVVPWEKKLYNIWYSEIFKEINGYDQLFTKFEDSHISQRKQKSYYGMKGKTAAFILLLGSQFLIQKESWIQVPICMMLSLMLQQK